jgi:hypothetical protein
VVELKFSAATDKVYAMLTDAKWLEQRCLELGEISASVKVKHTAKGAAIIMQRRIRRDLPALIAKVLSTETDMTIDESWLADGDGYSGSLTLSLAGQPVKVTADFSLMPAGKGCVYHIQHKAKCSVPLIGGVIEKFAIGEVESGCADELDYLAKALKKRK